MSAVRYWERGRDPFAPIKRRELESEALWHGLKRSSRIPRTATSVCTRCSICRCGVTASISATAWERRSAAPAKVTIFCATIAGAP